MTNDSPQTLGLSVAELFGNIDVYLFDQLQKGRFTANMRVLDAGCGNGRNIVYMLRTGFDVHAVDRDPAAIQHVRGLAANLGRSLPADNFKVGDIANLPFPDQSFDIVLGIAVLHFAESERNFGDMCRELMRVLRPSGYLFTRLTSNIGLEDRVAPLGQGRFRLPDGSERFLVSQESLEEMTHSLNGELFEPIKTVNVQGLRCMTTWCVQKK